MSQGKEKSDKHFPTVAHDNPFRKLINPPGKLFRNYIERDQVVADLGCGPGYYSLPMAECVGSRGKVYAVDSDERCIRALRKKRKKLHRHNIDARISSAHDLSFIRSRSVDYVLANGLLSSMAPKNHEACVKEIKRILKQDGKAYISVAKGSMSYVDKGEWEEILSGFHVGRRGSGFLFMGDRWALVSLKHEH